MDGTVSQNSQVRGAMPQRGDKEDKGKRSTRYKEKYQIMRDRFDKAREAYLRDLELANEKIRKLQEENDLLLDAMLSMPPSHSPVNSRRYPSPPPQQYAPSSQSYGPSHAPYGGPPPPPQPTSAPVYQHPPRLEHADSVPPPPPPPHSYSYSYPQTQPSRQYQYPPYGSNARRDI